MRDLIVNKTILINEYLNFIKYNKDKFKMLIAFGTAYKVPRYLCKELDIHNYFLTIHVVPRPKNKLVEGL